MSTVTIGKLLPETAAFLENSPIGLVIDGQSRPAQGGKTFATVDPGSGNVLAQVAEGDGADIDLAVQSADRAFKHSGWARMPPSERGVYLHRLADLVDERARVLTQIESLDVGKPLAQARGDVWHFSKSMRYYADLALSISYSNPIPVSKNEARVVRHPYGVCGFVLPWNFPLLLAGWNLAPALAAGNTMVVKPAEDTPLSTLYVARLAQEAGIPDGVLNVVAGMGETAGAALSAHPGLKRMGFTGSPEVGRLIAAACGRNLVPVKLELGGKGAAVVFEDAPIEATANALVQAVTLNTGQVCCTATRWAVHETIYDRFVECATERMSALRIGYGADPKTQMGPLVSAKQVDRVLGYLDKACQEGARQVLVGGRAQAPGCEGGFYVKPAILEGSPDNVAAREEIFGPVPFLLKFGSEDEVVEMVNRSPYGLANSVWTQDMDRANRVAEELVAGNSWINAHNVFLHGVPYCGVNLSGMGGGVLGPDTLYDYLRPQSVVRPI